MKMRRYYQFGKKHFEFGVREFLIKNKLGFLKDITESYIEEGNETWERVYTISTANRSVEILVFSSIDIRTGYVREHGDDAVRLVLRWKTRSGYVYRRVAKHLRIDTLFNNMKKSVENVQGNVFNLKYNEFSKEEK
ncbi:hypothetical protein PQE75_gp060 [Bacillus phage vB_BcoS-136]|uniref:Uncharacterized protein n=1 Tax=Bacillus phage vB_BcoS-136 TaxID=2419619 RepID=A0A3G3BVB3_9CAUD|nr:hypothetical protein PQE75_gp060 [Bacillus phage vB_BcoS-136]AYP68192.1 hypothetical protein vBBcoS136_00060 [Bacillus phage vB_BcoS-136]